MESSNNFIIDKDSIWKSYWWIYKIEMESIK